MIHRKDESTLARGVTVGKATEATVTSNLLSLD